MPNVSCILAAHNEEAIIAQTIESLFSQTHEPFEVIVAADNCTDQTVHILAALQEKYGKRLSFFETVNNSHKKGGALNQAFPRISPEADYVLQMDADTILDEQLLAEGLKELTEDPTIGGICSRCNVLDFPGGNWWNWLLWKMQHIEYSMYDSIRIETYGDVRILSGAVSIFPKKVLEQVLRKRGEIWSKNSIVEDYTLTIDIRSLDWKTKVGLGMFSYTDTMQDLLSLYRQRDRWYTGAYVELQKRGYNKVTKPYFHGFLMFFLMLILQTLSVAVITTLLFHHIPFTISMVGIVSLVAVWLNKLMRIHFIQPTKWYDIVLVASFIPDELYIVFRNLLMVWFFLKFFIKPTEQW